MFFVRNKSKSIEVRVTLFGRLDDLRHPRVSIMSKRSVVRSVTLNLANKFSQCTFSVAEHYDLFSDLIILRQA